jgi:selenocysteine-specific elongation factor
MLDQLRQDDPLARAAAALYFAGLRGWSPQQLPRTAGIETFEPIPALLRDRGVLQEIRISPTRTLRLHRDVLERLGGRVERALVTMHRQQPLRSAIDRKQLRQAFDYLEDALLDAVLQHLQEAGRVRLLAHGVAAAGCGPQLSQNERKLLNHVLETYRTAGIQAPSVSDVQRQAPHNQSAVPQLIALAVADGQLVQVAGEYLLHQEVDRQLRELLKPHLAAANGLTLSQIREILKTTRKYAVPYCEYLDRIGFTRREGDLRRLGNRADC